jgi:hypothetical protein
VHKKIVFLLLFLLIGGGSMCHAQSKQLSVYKKNGQLGKRFYEGDRIQLKVGPHGWISGDIEWLLKDTLIVAGFKVGLNQIQAVRTYKAAALGAAANLGIAGVLWPGIVAINGLTSDSRPLVTNSAIISSVAMLTGAAFFYRIGLRTYHTTEVGRLRITDFNLNPSTPPVHVPATAPAPQSE